MRNDELYHHGVPGMKWGVRRYQNFDGSYTAAGQRRHDRWMASAAKDMATKAYYDGTFTYVWTDPDIYRKNLNYASYASYTANSRRKNPD